ncbi:MAG: replicative DNA helicase [Candidatus Jorgensenbacteria bacterium]|nr:replicative DNA helicase [Candidatus Jorgensenbacteria bacterium]
MSVIKQTQFKVPPQDLDAEVSVLGSLMLDKNAIIHVTDILSPYDFYHPAHQKIYEVILELFERGEPIDILTVAHKLKGKKTFKDVGGTDYLTELVSRVPTSAHIEQYATIVKEKRVRREIINASSVINEQAFEHADFESLIDQVEQKIFGISQRSRPQKFAHIKEGLPEAYERLEKLHQGDKNSLRGVPTHFTKLDNLLSGLQRSDLIILGARPSTGKTAFALDIARQTALSGHAVGIFSVEMSRDQIIDRFIASQAQIPLWRLRSGRLNDELEFALVQQALDELSKAPIFIDDSSSPTILQMRSIARRLQLEHKLDLLIVDYIQLIRPNTSSDNVVAQVSEISRGLKSLARELNIPVLALSQLSRDIEKRDSKLPRLSDLRESGSLEQDADVVMFLSRDMGERSDLPEDGQGIVKVFVAKHRNGPTGAFELGFDKEKASFRNMDTAHIPEDY